jgi:hypothetical protein
MKPNLEIVKVLVVEVEVEGVVVVFNLDFGKLLN